MTYHTAPGILRMSERPMQDIATTIGGYFGISLEEMQSRSREKEIVTARQIAMYFMYYSGKYSLGTVGKFFDRDHTTVIHSLNQVKNFMETEPDFNELIEKMKTYSYVRYIPPSSEVAIKKVVEKRKMARPKAIYDNKSAMGVADEFRA